MKKLLSLILLLTSVSPNAWSQGNTETDMERYVGLKRKIHSLNLIKFEDGTWLGTDDSVGLSKIIIKMSMERDRLEKKLGLVNETTGQDDAPGSLEEKWDFDSRHE